MEWEVKLIFVGRHPGPERNCVLQDVRVAKAWRENGSFQTDRERKLNFHTYIQLSERVSAVGRLRTTALQHLRLDVAR